MIERVITCIFEWVAFGLAFGVLLGLITPNLQLTTVLVFAVCGAYLGHSLSSGKHPD